MIYRKLDANGDYSFGLGLNNFWQNSPDAVAQAIKTTLALMQGEWFLDNTAGTPYSSQILGTNTQSTYDLAISDTILGVEGVKSILSYSSTLINRNLQIQVTIDTIYGATTLSISL